MKIAIKNICLIFSLTIFAIGCSGQECYNYGPGAEQASLTAQMKSVEITKNPFLVLSLPGFPFTAGDYKDFETPTNGQIRIEYSTDFPVTLPIVENTATVTNIHDLDAKILGTDSTSPVEHWSGTIVLKILRIEQAPKKVVYEATVDIQDDMGHFFKGSPEIVVRGTGYCMNSD